MFRLKGSILNLTLLDLDHNGQVLISSSKGHQPNRNSKGHASNFTLKTRPTTSSNLGSPSAASSSMSNVSVGSSNLPTSSSGLSTATGLSSSNIQTGNETASGGQQGINTQMPPSVLPLNTQQLLLIVSERQARVVALPSQQMIGKCILSIPALRADVVYMKTLDSHCLFVYFITGQVASYAIPSLRIIKEFEMEPLSNDFRIESNINFNLDGHLIQFASPSELAKYCANSSLHDNLLALKPTLIKDIEIPEPPKQGLIKALFSVATTPFEKDEVFTNTKQPTTSTRTASAKQYGKQPAGIEGIRQAAQGTLAGELAKTRQVNNFYIIRSLR